LFRHKVSARKFATTKVDQFSGEHTDIVIVDTNSNEGSGEGSSDGNSDGSSGDSIEERREYVQKE